jgi:hypothetical protein
LQQLWKKCPVFTDGRTKNNSLDLLSKAKNQEFQAIADDGTCLETMGRSFFTNQRGSKMGKNVPSADDTNADPSAIKTNASISHRLVREGSREINATEIDQYLNSITDQSKEQISKKGEDIAVDVNISKDTSPAHFRQVMPKKGKVIFADTTTATVFTPNIINQSHIKSQIPTPANQNTNASPTSENPSCKEEKISAGVTTSLIHEGSETLCY